MVGTLRYFQKLELEFSFTFLSIFQPAGLIIPCDLLLYKSFWVRYPQWCTAGLDGDYQQKRPSKQRKYSNSMNCHPTSTLEKWLRISVDYNKASFLNMDGVR